MAQVNLQYIEQLTPGTSISDKYLNGSGLSALWERIKTFVSSFFIKNGENGKNVQILDTDTTTNNKSEILLTTESIKLSNNENNQSEQYLLLNSDGIYINGDQEENEVVTKGTLSASYDVETKTLTINNFTLE